MFDLRRESEVKVLADSPSGKTEKAVPDLRAFPQ